MYQGLQNKRALLEQRAALLRTTRHFFDSRGVIEVDPTIIAQGVAVDTYIDLVAVIAKGKRCYLHSSPEMKMKRLLGQGSGDIYFLGHVFRDHEVGRYHQIEFTMLEWYRVGWTLAQLQEEVILYLRTVLGPLPIERYSYPDLFTRYVGSQSGDADELFGLYIQPHLGNNVLTIVDRFPKSIAALSDIEGDIALRFEVFYQGQELANGYQECLDAEENRSRLNQENAQRRGLGKEEYPLDEAFLRSLEAIPSPCAGVSIGIDRVFMLLQKGASLEEVLPFVWEDE